MLFYVYSTSENAHEIKWRVARRLASIIYGTTTVFPSDTPTDENPYVRFSIGTGNDHWLNVVPCDKKEGWTAFRYTMRYADSTYMKSVQILLSHTYTSILFDE